MIMHLYINIITGKKKTIIVIRSYSFELVCEEPNSPKNFTINSLIDIIKLAEQQIQE